MYSSFGDANVPIVSDDHNVHLDLLAEEFSIVFPSFIQKVLVLGAGKVNDPCACALGINI